MALLAGPAVAGVSHATRYPRANEDETCTASNTGQHDTCSVARSPGKFVMTVTANLANSICSGSTSTGCTYSMFVRSETTIYGPLTKLAVNCPGDAESTTSNTYLVEYPLTPVGSKSLICTMTWTWDPTKATPAHFDVIMAEQDGLGDQGGSSGEHTFNADSPVPPLVPSFEFAPVSGKARTLIESLQPQTDPGRFDLKVDGKTLKAKAADGSDGETPAKAGTHVISQTISTGSLTDYAVLLQCTANGKLFLSTPATEAAVTLKSATAIVCTFTDVDTGTKHCDVPVLTGKSKDAAKSALGKADCTLGKVTLPKKPKKSKKHKAKKLVVASSSPSAYVVLKPKAKIGLTFRYKP